MNADASLQASFWLMIFFQTLGSVDMPGHGDRKLPAPRSYLATIVIWAVLQTAADAGFDKAARASAWITVLAGLVFGPSGQKLVNLLGGVTSATTGEPAPASTDTGQGRTRTGQPIRQAPGQPYGATPVAWPQGFPTTR